MATASTGSSPTGELTGEQVITHVDDIVGQPVSRVIIRDPDATAEDFVELGARARPARHRLRRRLDRLARPLPGRRLQGLGTAARRRPDRPQRGRRTRHRRRPQRHRDARLGRPRGRDGPVGRRGQGGCRPRHGEVLDDGAAVEMARWFPIDGRGAAPRRHRPRRHAAPLRRHRHRPHPPGARGAGARGVPVVFTTGRPIRWMESLWDDVGGHGLAICSNGGIVYDVAARRVRDFRAVPREVGISIAEQVRAAVPGTRFAIEHTSAGRARSTSRATPTTGPSAAAATRRRVFRDDVVKILAVHDELDPRSSGTQVEAVGRRPGRDHLVLVVRLVEISAAGRHQGHQAGRSGRGDRGRRRRRGGLRGHAQRPADAGVGGHVVRHGQRAPVRARRRRPRRARPTTRTAWQPCWLGSSTSTLARVATMIRAARLAAALLLACLGAWSCRSAPRPRADCTCKQGGLEQQVDKADAVFTGTHRLPWRPTATTTPTSITASRVYQGEPERSDAGRVPRQTPHACGLGDLDVGTTLPLLRHRHRGPLRRPTAAAAPAPPTRPGRQDREDPRRGHVGRAAAAAGGHAHPRRGGRAAGFARMAAPGAAARADRPARPGRRTTLARR